jgi:hypothetical protein
MVSSILAEVHAHTERVEKNEDRCELAVCPRCGERPEAFKRHALRRRTFLVVVGRLVHSVLSYLVRWKCPRCRTTFTAYPAFALPCKRYVREAILDHTGRYLATDGATYRAAAAVDKMPVFHGSEASRIDDRTLQPSTLFRWITTLGALTRTVRAALHLIHAAGASDVFRRLLPVAPRKYRSEARRQRLETTQALRLAEEEYPVLFGRSIFPALATACGWS